MHIVISSHLSIFDREIEKNRETWKEKKEKKRQDVGYWIALQSSEGFFIRLPITAILMRKMALVCDSLLGYGNEAQLENQGPQYRFG